MPEKIEQLKELLNSADVIAQELMADADHSRSPIIATIRSCTKTGLEQIENHTDWLAANPLEK